MYQPNTKELIEKHGPALALAFVAATGHEAMAQGFAVDDATFDEESRGDQMTGDRFDGLE